MNSEKTIESSLFGSVLLRKSRTSKAVRITVKSTGEVQVTLPWRASFELGEAFLAEKIEWVSKSVAKAKKRSDTLAVIKPGTVFKTRYHELEFVTTNNQNISMKAASGRLVCEHAPDTDFEKPSVQKFIKQCIVEVLRLEAKKHLPKRTAELAEEFGFRYTKVSVRNAGTRWGSCSGVNNISLNIHLMMLPDELIDYVILHELTHTVHKNHGPGFWSHLEKVCPNCTFKRKALHKYRLFFSKT